MVSEVYRKTDWQDSSCGPAVEHYWSAGQDVCEELLQQCQLLVHITVVISGPKVTVRTDIKYVFSEEIEV